MKGEIELFRKKFLGGFNRQDVVNYITRVTGERNAQREGREKAELEVKRLTAEVTALRLELTEANIAAEESLNYKVNAIKEAREILTEFQTDFQKLRSDIAIKTKTAGAELDAVRKTIAAIPYALDIAEEKFAKIQAGLAAEESASKAVVKEAAAESAGKPGLPVPEDVGLPAILQSDGESNPPTPDVMDSPATAQNDTNANTIYEEFLSSSKTLQNVLNKSIGADSDEIHNHGEKGPNHG